MITSSDELIRYVRADLGRYGSRWWLTLLRLPQARWQVRLRLTEYWCNTQTHVLGRGVGALLRQRLQAAGRRLGYTIPINVVGPGLRLPHVGTIVINGAARVGANCQVLQGVTLAAHHGRSPELGDDVYVAPNATLVGGIRVGERAWIGAGSVVTKDVPPGEVWGGVPAHMIHLEHD